MIRSMLLANSVAAKRSSLSSVSAAAAAACASKPIVRFKRDDATPKQYEKEIVMQIEKEFKSTIPEFPIWNENLASDSEAIVKANQSPDKSIEELQEETVDIIKSKEEQGAFPMANE